MKSGCKCVISCVSGSSYPGQVSISTIFFFIPQLLGPSQMTLDVMILYQFTVLTVICHICMDTELSAISTLTKNARVNKQVYEIGLLFYF